MNILLIKNDLETFSTSELSTLYSFFHIPDEKWNDKLWLLALEISKNISKKIAKMSPNKPIFPPNPNFFKKFNGTLFDKIPPKLYYECLFNLYLVGRGARKAFLFESSQYSSNKEAKDIRKIIRQKLPEIKETEEDKAAQRYFYSNPNIIIPDDLSDEIIGQLLEFNCSPTAMYNQDKLSTKTINYILITPNGDFSFYTEVCYIDKIIDESKTIIFQKIAKELGFNVKLIITFNYSKITFLDKFKEQDWKFFINNKDEIINILYNTLPATLDYAENKYETFIQNDKDLLLLALLMNIKDPFEPLFPLTVDKDLEYTNIMDNFVNHYLQKYIGAINIITRMYDILKHKMTDKQQTIILQNINNLTDKYNLYHV